MPTASEPRITLRLDHRVHGALLDAAKQAKRKPATLARLLLEDALVGSAVEQASGSVSQSAATRSDVAAADSSSPATPAPAESPPKKKLPSWAADLPVGMQRTFGPIPKKP